MSVIIDRRLNSGQKNLGNRQRFIRKAKNQIKQSIRENLQNRKIADTESGENIKIPVDTIGEPHFNHDWNSGTNRRVLPGNKDYIPHDQIEKPKKGQGDGKGNKASNDPSTDEDDFQFVLTRDEFYDLVFEDLELPEMVRKQLKTTKSWVIKREGISTAGNPSNLNVIRTMKSSLGRRIILRKPNEKEIELLEQELEGLDPADPRYTEIQEKIAQLSKKVKAVSYVDPLDLRYNVFSKKPAPSNSAVMFCIMDVSGSMDENKKDLAKRFFMLLYMFLNKKYDQVKVEFIRHHTSAKRVTEHEFFYDKENGGTTVSSALELTYEIIKAEYDPNLYNIYLCQASDGDNWDDDNERCRQLLTENILPLSQYMAYIEINDRMNLEEYPMLAYMNTRLFNTYKTVADSDPKLQVNKVHGANDIWPVFRRLFEKR